MFTDRGVYTVFSRGSGDTLVLLLHGGGYSGLTWSLGILLNPEPLILPVVG